MKIALLLFCLCLPAFAQINILFKPTKKQFVAYEPVTMNLTITNRTGKTATLQGIGLDNWLDVNVYDKNRQLLSYKSTPPAYQAVKIAAGQTVTKTISISNHYDLSRYGTYSVSASVRLPGNTQQAVRSNSSLITITNGRVLATQKIGLPGTASARQYEVIKFNGEDRTVIYIKLTNDYSKQVVVCNVLSPMVPNSEPQIAVDRNNNLHLLYLITRATYVHHIIAPTGTIKKRQYHKSGSAYSKPRLESFAKGDVKVAGTILFDPKKAVEAANADRKLSDRPNF